MREYVGAFAASRVSASTLFVYYGPVAITYAFSALGITFAVALVVEKENGLKAQLIGAGLPRSVYWISALIADWFVLSIGTVLALAILLGSGVAVFTKNTPLSYILLFTFFNALILLISYEVSLLFSKAETAARWIARMLTIVIIVPYVVAGLILRESNSIVNDIAGLIPSHAFHEGLVALAQADVNRNPYTIKTLFDREKPMFRILITLFLEIIVSAFILVIADTWSARKWQRLDNTQSWFRQQWDAVLGRRRANAARRLAVEETEMLPLHSVALGGGGGAAASSAPRALGGAPPSSIAETIQIEMARERTRRDSDVVALENAITDTESQFLAAMLHIRKVYPKTKQSANEIQPDISEGPPREAAVEDVSLGVSAGTCFGLLGPNGSGKTTTIQMLYGQLKPTSGHARLLGTDMFGPHPVSGNQLGICAQSDALWEHLTAREHLRLFALIKGVPRKEVEAYVTTMLAQLGLEEFADRAAGTFSGGTKRKLMVGIAFTGPAVRIIFLDEPTNGLDPMSRRRVWRMIDEARVQRNLAIVLTTHSLEEAEALTQKMAIIVEGRLKAFGSAFHLKSKFGGGYELSLQSNQPEVAKRWVAAQLSEQAKCQLEWRNSLRFEIPKNAVAADLFERLEAAKTLNEAGIFDYTLSFTSLEKVFIEIARQQQEQHLLEQQQQQQQQQQQ